MKFLLECKGITTNDNFRDHTILSPLKRVYYGNKHLRYLYVYTVSCIIQGRQTCYQGTYPFT